MSQSLNNGLENVARDYVMSYSCRDSNNRMVILKGDSIYLGSMRTILKDVDGELVRITRFINPIGLDLMDAIKRVCPDMSSFDYNFDRTSRVANVNLVSEKLVELNRKQKDYLLRNDFV